MSSLLTSWRRSDAPLRRLLLSELLTQLSGSLSQLALAWWIAQRGGAADLTVYGLITALLSLLAMGGLSPLGDRWPKPRVLRLGCGLLLLDALLLAMLAQQDLYRLPLLIMCGGLSMAAHAMCKPVQASMLPELVPCERLPEAIRLRRAAQALGSLLGPGLAGALLASGDSNKALMVNLLLSGATLYLAMQIPAGPLAARQLAAQCWGDDLIAGLRAKWGVPLDRWWTLVGALMMVFLQPALGLLLPLRIQQLQLSAGWLGACAGALSLGVLLGVAGLADLLVSKLDRVRALYAAVLICGLTVAAMGLWASATGLVALFGLLGLCMSVTQLIGQTHRLLAIPEHFRARMNAAQLLTAGLAASAAPALAGGLLQWQAVDHVYLILACGFLASASLLRAVPGLANFLGMNHDQVHNWYGRRYPAAFATRHERDERSP